MKDQIEAYKDHLEGQLLRAKAELSKAQRSISLIEQKLSNPEAFFKKELKRGAVKVKRLVGVPAAPPAAKAAPAVVKEKTEEKPKKKGFWSGDLDD